MGLFSQVLLFPLAPVRGVGWINDCLMTAADRELHDPAVLRAKLHALNEEYEDGLIGEAEFVREEERLLDQLEHRTRPDGGTHRPTGPEARR